METESVLCCGRGEVGLFREECLLPAHDWSIPMQVRISGPHSLIGPNSTIMIGHKEATRIGANEDVAAAALIAWDRSLAH